VSGEIPRKLLSDLGCTLNIVRDLIERLHGTAFILFDVLGKAFSEIFESSKLVRKTRWYHGGHPLPFVRGPLNSEL
jgi:hypothetical protein